MTARLTLVTVAMRADGCFSAALWDGRPFAVTLEKTFDDGRPIVGAGIYQCVRGYFYRGRYPTFEILVEGHTEVKFHKANVEADLDGCVGVAKSFSALGGATAIADSAGGFAELMGLARGLDGFEMEVTGR